MWEEKLKLYLTATFLFAIFLCPEANSQDATKFLIGYGKADITYTQGNVGLFGFGDYHQRISDSDNGCTSRIYSRAISIKDPETGKQIIYVHADLAVIFTPLRSGLISEIRENLYPDFNESSLMMSASHTHCAPSGMSHYPLYMMTAPGYNPALVEFTVSKIYDSISQSLESQSLSIIEFKEGSFAPDIPVAFNRALPAYNENECVIRYEREETHLALNRNMPMLSFVDSSGVPSGFINWFGVHPIEVMDDHDFIDGASKGYAASFSENEMPSNTVAIFAQSSAGDVMTSDPHNPKAFDAAMRLVLEDPEYSHKVTSLKQARWNGQLQADKALEIRSEKDGFQIQGSLDYAMIYVDMSSIVVDERFSHGEEYARTSSPCQGTPFFSASFEWNDNSFRRRFLNLVAKKRGTPPGQFPKQVVVDGEAKTFCGVALSDYNHKGGATFFMNRIAGLDLVIKEAVRQQDLGALEEHTLLPKILPIQLLRIGNVVIAGIPTEITTIAYNRLQATLLEALKDGGIDKVVISSYANEYAGYTTTYEEYLVQRYEGGHTLYGRHQLGAFQTEFEKLAIELLKPEGERALDLGVRPPVFSEGELSKRSGLLPLE